MRPRSALALAVLLGVAVAAWFLTRPGAGPQPPKSQRGIEPAQGSDRRTINSSAVAPATSEPALPEPARERAPSAQPPAPPPTVPPAGGEVPPGASPQTTAATERQLLEVLENVRVMIRDYRTVLGENPVGTNAEIMRAINGHNAKQAKIGAPAGQGLNGNGELIDPWGTPFFFHQISRTEMEIRSAGPDRVMWTGDDREVK